MLEHNLTFLVHQTIDIDKNIKNKDVILSFIYFGIFVHFVMVSCIFLNVLLNIHVKHVLFLPMYHQTSLEAQVGSNGVYM